MVKSSMIKLDRVLGSLFPDKQSHGVSRLFEWVILRQFCAHSAYWWVVNIQPKHGTEVGKVATGCVRQG